MSDVKNHVKSIIAALEGESEIYVNGDGAIWEHSCDCTCGADAESDCECEDRRGLDGFSYLQDVLDINWILNSDRTYKGARVLVAFGGPNIWIDTVTGEVEGAWWNDSYTERYNDGIGLDEALEELFGC